MRVCVLIDVWEPLWGGGPKNVWEISRRLVKNKNLNIDIFTRSLKENGVVFSRNENYSHNRLRIFRIGPVFAFFNIIGRLTWLVSVILAVLISHRKKPYDLIHAHAYSAGIPGKILSILLSIPIVFTVHGSNNLDLNKKTVTAFFERFILTRILYTRQISVSYSFLKHSNLNHPIVISNGVDLNDFNKKRNSSIQKRLFTFLFVGRFDQIKGVNILVKAFSLFYKKHPNTKLMLVGYGYEEEKIKNTIFQLQLGNAISLKGKQTGKTLIDIYKSVDIVVVPSFSEGQSIVILEAFAAKKPVIATSVGDNARFVVNSKTGFLVFPENMTHLYRVMEKAYLSKRLHIMGQKAHSLVHNYQWDTVTARVKKVYESVI